MALFHNLLGSAAGAVKLPIWPLMVSVAQVLDGEITIQQARDRYMDILDATGQSELLALRAWASDQLQAGKTRLEVFHDMWNGLLAVEFGYSTEQQFKQKFDIP